jgi:penicillin amidase
MNIADLFRRAGRLGGIVGLLALASCVDADLPVNIPTNTYTLPALSQDAEILVDPWGVPHIFAKTPYDAYVAQGFNAARDRLWQIDLWRKRSMGLLARDFGPAYVEQDRAARLFLYRGDMKAEWTAYSSDTKRIVEAFVAGVNFYVGLTRRNAQLLPPEFAALGYQPDFWAAEDVVRMRSHGLLGNSASEAVRARVVCGFGLEVDAFRRGLEPPWQTRVPEGLDPCAVPADVLRVYNLARGAPTFTPDQLRGIAPPQRSAADVLLDGLALPTSASNNSAVAPRRSTTGRAILANDPHRVHSLPNLRYIAHLAAPGLNVIGAGEPGLPGVSLGHNGRIATGLTVFATDQDDIYVYETNPANPNEYRYQGRWEPMRVVSEEIDARGAALAVAELKFTRHGPIVYEDRANRRAFAIRAAWLEPGMAPYLSSIEYMRAQNWDEFLAAMNRHGLPSLNYLYADVNGNIGWAPSGLTPIRPNWDGLMPVPGDGRYEWAGFRVMDTFPRALNPPAGWFGTSNEMNLPPDYPYRERRLAFEWADPNRMMRQRQFFTDGRKFSIEDFLDLQNDYVSTTAQRVTALLAGVEAGAEPRVAAAIALLRGWDHRVVAESAAAAIFEVWFHKHLRQAVVARVVPPAAVPLVGAGDPQVIVALLENPDRRLGPDPRAARDELLRTSLLQAIAELDQRLGNDMKSWAWGRLHHAQFTHPLSAVVDEKLRARLDVGPLPKSGSNDTLGHSGYRLSDFRLTSGSSVRLVIDVGDWDNSWAINGPGQSGDPASAHYRDLFEPWLNGQYFPLLYSRAAIEQAAERRIELRAPR